MSLVLLVLLVLLVSLIRIDAFTALDDAPLKLCAPKIFGSTPGNVRTIIIIELLLYPPALYVFIE